MPAKNCAACCQKLRAFPSGFWWHKLHSGYWWQGCLLLRSLHNISCNLLQGSGRLLDAVTSCHHPAFPAILGSVWELRHASRNNSSCGNNFSGMVPRDKIQVWHLFFLNTELKNGAEFTTWLYIIFFNYTFSVSSVPHLMSTQHLLVKNSGKSPNFMEREWNNSNTMDHLPLHQPCKVKDTGALVPLAWMVFESERKFLQRFYLHLYSSIVSEFFEMRFIS